MNNPEDFLDAPPGQVPVRGFLHRPAYPDPAHPDSDGNALVLTHGAGANANAPLLVALADVFCAFGWFVLRCDLPFRQLRPHGPPQRGAAERDQQGLKAAVASMRRLTAGRIFLGGHSYGGRQASMLAGSQPDLPGEQGRIDSLLLLSYPLHPPLQPAQLRTAHFPALHTPAMFVHGDRDGFGSLGELAAALKLVPARTELLPIPAAGHELMTKRNRAGLPSLIAESFRQFVNLAP